MPLRRAMVNAIQETGGTAAVVSRVDRERMPGIPWGVVVVMRNALVHGYDEIDFEVVWKVATDEAAVLIAARDNAFASWPLTEPPKD